MSSHEGRLTSVGAERAIISILLMRGRELLTEISSEISATDFTDYSLRAIYDIFTRFDDHGREFDLELIMGDATAVGPEVAAACVAASLAYAGDKNLLGYCKAIRSASVRREISSAGIRLQQIANAEGQAESLVEEAHATVSMLGVGAAVGGLRPLSHSTSAWLDRLDQNSRKVGGLSGISTGNPELDRKTGGFGRGDLIIIAGRPSMGKTALALSTGLSMAKAQDQAICMFSMEMGHEEIISRAVSRLSGVDLLSLRNGDLTEDNWQAVNKALAELPQLDHFLIDDRGGNPVPAMRARAMRVMARRGGKLAAIIIDYLQLMESQGENRAAGIAEITRGLKRMAKELQVPVILLSQLNRELERRQDRRPMMSDLKDSGAIEQDADLILFVYRDVVYTPGTLHPGVAEIIIGKQRNGPIGSLLMAFNDRTASFRALDHHSANMYWSDMKSVKGGVSRGFD